MYLFSELIFCPRPSCIFLVMPRQHKDRREACEAVPVEVVHAVNLILGVHSEDDVIHVPTTFYAHKALRMERFTTAT